ncbi:MAG: hypothetical protein PQJ50_17530 [Spirochaetales bacterium]|nr:hypothetical protein [Spirochaetales bacterium]
MKNSYIEYRIKEKDKREKDLYLTKRAWELVPALIRRFNDWETEIAKGIPESQIETSRDVLTKMIDNLTAMENI